MIRFVDLFFNILFPAGFHTVPISLYVFLAVFGFLVLYQVLLKQPVFEKSMAMKKGGLWGMGLLFLTGLFSPILMSFYATILFFVLVFHIGATVKNSTTPQKIMNIAVLIVLGVCFLIQYALWGLIWFMYSKMYGLVLFVGVTGGLLFFVEQKITKMNLLHKIPELLPNMSKTIKVMAVMWPIVSAGIFLPIIYIRPHEVPTSNTYTGSISLKIMSYNIRNPGAIEKDSRDQWSNRKDPMATYIATFDLDIFGVQEAYLRQVNFLKRNLTNRNYDYFGIGRDDGTFSGEYEAIFYDEAKFEFIDGDTFWLSDTPAVPSNNWDTRNYRSCTWVILEEKITTMQFFVLNTHFSTASCAEIPCVQQKSAELINTKIAELTGDLPVILMGDFNMKNTSLAFSYLEEHGAKPLHDGFKEFHNGTVPFDYTTNEFQPLDPDLNKKRIDYIFLSASIVTEFHDIPKDFYNEGRTYSDHYPVVATISIST
ncbi:MAG: endonuclease/exonuclease/phosphatase family protein [Promethearchaeota archaeon]